MDQITKALDEANKRNNQTLEDREYSWTGSNRPDSSRNGSSQPIANRELSSVNVAYDETRVVKLDSSTLESNRVIGPRTKPEVEQAYKLLRTQILQKLSLNDWNTFAVVSPRSGNGKTLTAINLAISLAKEVKQSVLLVDFDFRKPQVCKQLGIELAHDIGGYLFSDVPLSKSLINPSIERLVVLGNKTQLDNSSEVLGSPKLIRLVDELKQRYENRIVIFDLPPMLESDDAIAFLPYVEALLMVVEDGSTTQEDLERCAEQVGSKPMLGTVLNKGSG